MSVILTDRQRAAIRRRKARMVLSRALDHRAREWFPKQRTFYEDRSALVAAICSRRAGKTRGGCLHFLRCAASTPNGRYLYLNETRAEAFKMAWHGLRGDGMYSLAVKLGLNCKFNETNLTIHFPEMDSWIYLMGADDEAGVRKALGLAYHEVWWDEAQKIPAKLEAVIRSTLMPTLLDYGGRLRLTGTPSRQMTGLFYNVTRTDGEAYKRWSVHRWTMLDNPHFGHAVQVDGGWAVLDKMGAEIARVATAEEAAELVDKTRFAGGVTELQGYLATEDGPPDIDSPIMRREAFGEWVHEDALYVYDVHKVKTRSLLYAPARIRSLILRVPRMNGEQVEIEELALPKFPDLEACARDLPFYTDGRDYFFGLGVDIGFSPDPFAFVLGAWSLLDPVLYEVASWKGLNLDFYVQAAVLRLIGDTFHVGVPAADAGGSARPAVAGWSKEWSSRYGVALDEMPKSNKNGAIEACNADIRRVQYRMREGGLLYTEMSRVQWMVARTSTGKLVEDPSIPNDVADAGLYLHRRSFQHRFRPADVKALPGTPEWDAKQEQELLDGSEEEWEVHNAWH